MNPEQARQSVGPVLDHNCLPWNTFSTMLILAKKKSDDKKSELKQTLQQQEGHYSSTGVGLRSMKSRIEIQVRASNPRWPPFDPCDLRDLG